MRELKAQIATEFEQPSSELVTLLGKRIVSCKFTAKLQEQFTVILKRAISSHINDIIASRLSLQYKRTSLLKHKRKKY